MNRGEISKLFPIKLRWQIETLNRCLKTAGFNLEDTHLTHPERIERLLAMVCIAVVLAYLVCDHRDQCVKPIRIAPFARMTCTCLGRTRNTRSGRIS